MAEFYHSVTLNEERCVGCTNCIKRCPTEAIRVQGGKAVIASERCIDCGECIRICPHHAKRARFTALSEISGFTYKIALPAPSLYGQFNNLDDIDYVLTGIKQLGFDDVFEVSRAAELVSEATRKLLASGRLKRPVISSACPAVVRLIRVRFPDLCDHVLPLKSPMETAAALAKAEAVKKTGLPEEQIGCFFLTPCPAKVTDIQMPLGLEKSQVDGAIAISEIFPVLSHKMDHLEKVETLSSSGIIGVGWSTSGGEAAALLNEKYLAAGADIIETDSFNANAVSLADYRLEGLAREISRAAAEVARAAADAFTARNPQKPRFVAGSMGRRGQPRSPRGDLPPAGRRLHRPGPRTGGGRGRRAARRDRVRHAQRQGGPLRHRPPV